MSLLILLSLAAVSLASVDAHTCSLYPLYPYGKDRGDKVEYGAGEIVELETSVKFYGSEYKSIYIDINGLITFNGARKDQSSNVSIFFSKVNLQLENHGRVMYRNVDLTKEQDIYRMIVKDIEAIKETFTPNLVFIVTWKGLVGEYDSQKTNTFQFVMTSDAQRTVLIFNYGSISWIEDHVNPIKYRNWDSREEEYVFESANRLHIPEYSNIGIPGRLVQRANGNPINLENVTQISCRSCSVEQDTGRMTTFDGAQKLNIKKENRRYLISKRYQGDETGRRDQCKYRLKVITDGNGDVGWVSFSVGVHPGRIEKYKRNFAFSRNQVSQVEVRGHGAKTVITDFPYYEEITDNGQQLIVVVDKAVNGWIVRSITCQYTMTYNSANETTAVLLTLGPYYEGMAFGLCQNNNNNINDDDKRCTVPPKAGEVSAITATCSCPSKDKACNKRLNTM